MRVPDSPLTPNEKAFLTIVGIGVGQLIVVLLDTILGGPGPFVLFGL